MECSRSPNDRLRALLAEAGWTGGDLARGVNTIAAETGLRVKYRRASSAQWLAGGQPREPVPRLVTEALSRTLGRPITPSDAGFHRARTPGGPDHEKENTVVSQLAGLGRAATRRDLLRYTVYSLGLLTVPDLPEMAAPVEAVRQARRYPLRLGTTEIEAAAAALRLFSESERALGASLVRDSLAEYLAGTIAPWLRANTATAELRQRLLSVAAELTYLFGFLCFDDELHGAAQRYYRTALRLSAEAEDPGVYAIALRSMSVQAHALGHHGQAARLAQSAVETAASKVPAPTKAFLLGQLAVTSAGVGDHRRAAAELGSAERQLDIMPNESASVGAYHYASLAHQRSAVLASAGDSDGAIAALRESIRHRSAAEPRARAITQAGLAEFQLDRGRVEEAADAWNSFLDTYPSVHSGRVRTAMVTLRARMRPHQKSPAVRALLHRATALHHEA
ncbi:hypothetical protein [Amycolatopsis sp. NPDC059657]|uniref:hypothetical protein n=1 Tax=Amycolatopsis sp. NPDC059657 TaxID=3346899 RepID=UPI0036708843